MTKSLNFDCQFEYPSGFELNAKFTTTKQVTAITGPSGSGKTTILYLLAGLLRPGRGTISLGDRELSSSEAGRFLRPEQRQIGMLFQEHRLFPHLRVAANIEYGFKRRSTADRRISIARIAHVLEIEELLNRYPGTLSGGQKQRVALARAIACNPDLVLLDEPLTAIEPTLRTRIAIFIERVVEEFELTTLLVSHNQQLVDRLADEMVQIQNGTIIEPAVEA